MIIGSDVRIPRAGFFVSVPGFHTIENVKLFRVNSDSLQANSGEMVHLHHCALKTAETRVVDGSEVLVAGMAKSTTDNQV
jgi:hypothetical protein